MTFNNYRKNTNKLNRRRKDHSKYFMDSRTKGKVARGSGIVAKSDNSAELLEQSIDELIFKADTQLR